jgi:catechol 2,3-dioxygenase-like lactoylglutathione lyase family enzyme
MTIMKITSYYPVIMTDAVAATSAFYTAHFGFEETFSSDWYVHLRSKVDPRSIWRSSTAVIKPSPPQAEARFQACC